MQTIISYTSLRRRDAHSPEPSHLVPPSSEGSFHSICTNTSEPSPNRMFKTVRCRNSYTFQNAGHHNLLFYSDSSTFPSSILYTYSHIQCAVDRIRVGIHVCPHQFQLVENITEHGGAMMVTFVYAQRHLRFWRRDQRGIVRIQRNLEMPMASSGERIPSKKYPRIVSCGLQVQPNHCRSKALWLYQHLLKVETGFPISIRG
mmetsp:Transcript_24338/g.35137  ORF Transcript_24338/g.35137 Transcript_24338/m.35137 type:complete len:202 (+) Transcript_24338:766-1371(+)